MLGYGIYYYDTQKKKIDCIRFDLVADGDKAKFSTDSISAVRAFRFLRNQSFFKEIDKPNYIIWTDCGTHFRCERFVNFMMGEVSQEKKVSLNFFAPKHGKSNCDKHFAVLTRYFNQNSFKEKLVSSQEIVNAIVEGQRLSNLKRKLHELDELKVFAAVFTPELTDTLEFDIVTIPNITCYFNFENDIIEIEVDKVIQKSKTMFTKVFSDLKELKPLAIKKMKKPYVKTFVIDRSEENFYKEAPLKLDYLIDLNNTIRLKLGLVLSDFSEFSKEPCDSSLIVNETVDLPRSCPHECLQNSRSKKKVKHCESNEACLVRINYKLEDLLNNRTRIGQTSVQDELHRHGHPKTLKVGKKFVGVQELKEILISHYRFFHQQN